MEDYEIIGNNNSKLVYCFIKYNDRIYMALADQISGRRLGIIREDVFPIQLIYNKQQVIIAEYEFVFNRIYNSVKLENININQTAIDKIAYEEDNYIVPDESVISKELALEMYNKFKEVFGCK